jgi:hypothetical protein
MLDYFAISVSVIGIILSFMLIVMLACYNQCKKSGYVYKQIAEEKSFTFPLICCVLNIISLTRTIIIGITRILVKNYILDIASDKLNEQEQLFMQTFLNSHIISWFVCIFAVILAYKITAIVVNRNVKSYAKKYFTDNVLCGQKTKTKNYIMCCIRLWFMIIVILIALLFYWNWM